MKVLLVDPLYFGEVLRRALREHLKELVLVGADAAHAAVEGRVNRLCIGDDLRGLDGRALLHGWATDGPLTRPTRVGRCDGSGRLGLLNRRRRLRGRAGDEGAVRANRGHTGVAKTPQPGSERNPR